MSKDLRKTKENNEVKICGERACRAVYKQRKDDIIRVYLTEDRLVDVNDILKWCASTRRAYHIVDEADMKKIAQTKHHDGICFLTREEKKVDQNNLIRDLSSSLLVKSKSACIALLDGVQNPHNLGAIVRTASHFSVPAVIVAQSGEKDGVKLSTAAYRTAQGGTEDVEIIGVKDLAASIVELKKQGYKVYGTSDHKAKKNLFKTKLPEKTLFVFGSETAGISNRLLDLCDEIIIIPHSGTVKSLNVSSAFAICIAEYWRQIHD